MAGDSHERHIRGHAIGEYPANMRKEGLVHPGSCTTDAHMYVVIAYVHVAQRAPFYCMVVEYIEEAAATAIMGTPSGLKACDMLQQL